MNLCCVVSVAGFHVAAANSESFIADTVVRNNGSGIVVLPATGTSTVSILRSRADDNVDHGFHASDGSFVKVVDSAATGNTNGFVSVMRTDIGIVHRPSRMHVENSHASDNVHGVHTGNGTQITFSESYMSVSNSTIVHNGIGVWTDVGGSTYTLATTSSFSIRPQMALLLTRFR